MTKIAKFLTLASLLTILPVSAVAEPSEKEWARQRLAHGLMKPLSKKEDERSKFSRVIQPPRERRVEVLSSEVVYDDKGRGFLSFATEIRYGQEWREDFTGCVYRKTGQIYIAFGDEYRPAEYLFGQDVKSVKGVCVERRSPEPRS